MPLDTQVLSVPTGGGLNQKLDPKLVQPGQVTALANVTFDRVGALKKRPGNTLLPQLTDDGTPVPPFQQLVSYNDELLGVPWQAGYVHTLSTTNNDWVSGSVIDTQGNAQFKQFPEATVRRSTVAQSDQSVTNMTVAWCNGFLVYAWLEGTHNVADTGTLFVSVIDPETGTTVLGPIMISRDVASPRLASTNESCVITFLSGKALSNTAYDTMWCRVITIVPGQPIVVSDLHDTLFFLDPSFKPTGPYDTAATNDTLFCVSAAISSSFDGYIQAFGAAIAHGHLVSGSQVASDVLLQGNLGDESEVFAVGCDVIPSGTFYQLMGGWSWLGTAINNLSVACWQLTGSNLAFTPGTVTTPVDLTSFAINALPSSVIGLAWRNTGSCGVAYADQEDVPVPGGILGPYHFLAGQSALARRAKAAQLNFAGDTTQQIKYSNPYQRQNWHTNLLSKPWWVQNPWSDGGSKMYCLGYVDVYSTAQSVQEFTTVYVFDCGLDIPDGSVSSLGDPDVPSPSQQWRLVSTVSPRQLVIDGGSGVQFYTRGFSSNVAAIGSLLFYSTIPSNVGQGIEFPLGSSFQALSIDFSPLKALENHAVGNNLLVAAGTPTFYDGVNTGDIGFAYYPTMFDGYAWAQTGSQYTIDAGASMAPGTYGYFFVYEYTDAAGQVHQSAPSINPQSNEGTVITIVDPSGGSNATGSAVFFIPNLCTGNRNTLPFSGTFGSGIGQSNFPSVAVYRTTANGTVPYRLTPAVPPPELICDPQVAGLFWTDYAGDSSINGEGDPLDQQPVIYTQGGVLPYFSPPQARFAEVFQNSLWFAGTDDPKVLWWSNQQVQGLALSFDDAFQVRFDDGGDITAIKAMDSNLIVFKSDRIFYITGQQPNPEGQNNGLSPPTRIVSDTGCNNSRSVVLTPVGIMFQSPIGIYMLDRSLSVSNIGTPVSDLLKQFPNVTSAVIHPTMSQIRFTVGPGLPQENSPDQINSGSWGESNPWGEGHWGADIGQAIPDVSLPPGMTLGAVLVYDYLVKSWTVFYVQDNTVMNWRSTAPYPDSYFLTGTMPTSAVVWQGKYAWASSLNAGTTTAISGAVYVENSNTDAPLAETNSYTDNGTYVATQVDSAWVTPAGIQGFQRAQYVGLEGQAYDACNVIVSYALDYDQTAWWGGWQTAINGQEDAVNFRYHIGHQHCRSIKVRIVDFPPTTDQPYSDSGQGFQVTNIALQIGVKPGGKLQKLPANRSY